jgi:mycothiol synthase
MDPRIEVRLFDPGRAGRQELDEYCQLRVVTWPEWSDEPVADRDAMIAALTVAPKPLELVLHWAGYWDGRLVGHSRVVIPEQEGTTFVMPQITVHPEFRGRGIGTALLRAALPELRARDRTEFETWAVTKGGPGDRWAVNRGFRPVLETVLQLLAIREVDESLWDVDEVPGYRVVSWHGRTPDELVASYAAVQDALQDAPLGDTTFRYPQWTIERVRQAEAEQRSKGVDQPVVVAVHEATGEVVGYTEVAIMPQRRQRASQLGTGVAAAHRGHGLGRLIKARMARSLRAERPELAVVLTTTGAANAHMIRVNHEIGYVTTRTMLTLNAKVDELT